MKTKIVFSLVTILAVVILAGCGKKVQNENQNQGSENDQAQQQSPAEELTEEANAESDFEGGNLSTSLKELMGMGKSMKCNWTVSEGDGSGKGIIYVEGEKFREDLTIDEEGEKISTYVISDGTWIYQWSSNSKEGTKMQMSEVEKMAEENEKTETPDASNEENIMEEFYEKVDYNCEKWNADGSKFIPPSDIQFNDMTQMVKDMQENSQQMMQDVCQMCESLPASAKEECLKNCQQ